MDVPLGLSDWMSDWDGVGGSNEEGRQEGLMCTCGLNDDTHAKRVAAWKTAIGAHRMPPKL